MKKRMYNTFFRKFHNEIIAKTLSKVGYFILIGYYHIYRFLLKKNKNIVLDKSISKESREKLYELYKPTNMKLNLSNKKIDEKMDLSIVVPAYNVEQYISDCLESVLNQKTKYQYEVIIVNDGSTDNTDEIIKGYTSKKIKYITQENKGISCARNAGIDISTGKYIMFLDSDDILGDNAIDKMLDAIIAKRADIVVGGYYEFSDNDEHIQYYPRKDEVVEQKEKIVFNPGFPWGKIYKREIFNNIRFPQDMWFEDTIICSVVYQLCRKMVIIPEYVYGYRKNQYGFTNNYKNSIKALDHLWVIEYCIKLSEDNKIIFDDVFYGLVFNHMSSLLYRRISHLDDKVIRDAFYVACEIMDKLRGVDNYRFDRIIENDIEKAFITRNYKLWKLASFIV